ARARRPVGLPSQWRARCGAVLARGQRDRGGSPADGDLAIAVSRDTSDARRYGPRSLTVLAWFGVLAGPAAWAAQFLFGMQFGLARCESPSGRFEFPVHTLSVILAAAAVLVSVIAELAAVVVFRATHDSGDARSAPEITSGRLHFLGAVGITVNPLALAICVMAGVAVPLLSLCQQS